MHAMRNLSASALIRGGLSVKVVSERLRHANAAMTLSQTTRSVPTAAR